MKCDKKSMLLYAVTDRTWLKEQSLATQVEEALKGGVTFVQLREKKLDYDTFLEEAKRMKALCEKYHVPFVINDNVEIAIASNADGIHIGQSDGNVRDIRAKLGENKIIGVSAQTVEQAIRAQQEGADYLGVGAVFSTSTKLDADFVSYETLKSICDAVNIPVIAIGGISELNILELSGTGIDGIAVVSALFAKSEIKMAAKNLCNLSHNMVNL